MYILFTAHLFKEKKRNILISKNKYNISLQIHLVLDFYKVLLQPYWFDHWSMSFTFIDLFVSYFYIVFLKLQVLVSLEKAP